MDKLYRETTSEMEKMKVNPDYVIGWQSGYLNHPEREEQRTTDAYAAGYKDGREKNTGNFSNWVGTG